jgi:hypothetical protein
MNWNLVGSIYGRSSIKILILSRSINKHGRHRPFLFLIGWFLKIFSSETAIFLEINQSETRMACLLTDRDEMSILYRGSSIDASYQVSVHLAMQFQRRRFLKISQSETRMAWFLKKSSPLKPLGQINQNLVGSIYGRSSIKIAHLVPIR